MAAGLADRLLRRPCRRTRRLYEYRVRPATRCSSCGATTACCAPSRTCAATAATRCATASASGLTRAALPLPPLVAGTSPGHLREVPSRRGFGALRNEDYGLFPVAGRHVGTDGVRQPRRSTPRRWPTSSKGCPTTSRGPASTSSTARTSCRFPVAGNWKIADRRVQRDLPRAGHPPRDAADRRRRQRARSGSGPTTASSSSATGCPSPRFREPPDDQEVWDVVRRGDGHADRHRRRTTPAGAADVPAGRHAARGVRRADPRVGAPQGVDLLGASTTTSCSTMSQYNLFPNVSLVVFPDLFTVLRRVRARPPTRRSWTASTSAGPPAPDAPAADPSTSRCRPAATRPSAWC